jgi:tRNA(adenine34) deaminase
MRIAIDAAKEAFALGEVPIGAVIVKDGIVLSKAFNLRHTEKVATAHAEVLAINKACGVLGDWRLEGCDIYVTVEPCFMCAGAIIAARMRKVYFGAPEAKFGALISNAALFSIATLNHRPEFEWGLYQGEIACLMKTFFKEMRGNKSAS